MSYSKELLSPSRKPGLAVADRPPLAELLKNRVAVEAHFAQLGHTYRHGRLYRKFEHHVTRPALKLGLQMAGLYQRGLENALSPEVRKISLSFPDLPRSLEGFEILHLSDLHIDGTDGLTEALVPLLSRLRPDICVMTGDYRFKDHGSCEPVYPLLRELVSSIRARHGTFGILGNHDSSEIAYRLEDMGVRMLLNENVEIESGGSSLFLLGVDDPFDYHCDDLSRAQDSVPSGSFQVLLAHSPELYAEAAAAGVDLYLSGHTHAGQIRIPGFGSLRHNASCPRGYSFGHWRHLEMQGYTSAGLGCSSLPVRYNCPPEIVLIELKSAPGTSAF